jgi:hypothetical protein|tara:strand:+ start:103 stop:342 length:240 start_codon:yes stop_codon:yes gene_type:complete
MSRFGDLLGGKPVETPPVVDTAPSSVEPVEEEQYESDVSFQDMSKDELEDYGRTVGIELDRRHNKKKLIQELEDHLESE